LLQIEDDKSTVFTPKVLKWDEITIPDEIELQEPQRSAQIERRDIDQIIEEPDGRVIHVGKILHFVVLQIMGDPFLNAPRKQEILTISKGTDFVLLSLSQQLIHLLLLRQA